MNCAYAKNSRLSRIAILLSLSWALQVQAQYQSTYPGYTGSPSAGSSIARDLGIDWLPRSFSKSRLEIGTRALRIDLKENHQGEAYEGSFIGSINELKERQDLFGLRPYAQITIPVGQLRIGVGGSLDKLKVATLDEGGGDGDVVMKARMFYALISYPNKSRFEPYAEIGKANYKNSFSPKPEWYREGLRNFELENSKANYWAVGCAVSINPNWSADVYMRKVDVDVDGEYVFHGDKRDPAPFTFTMKHTAYGLGVRYVF